MDVRLALRRAQGLAGRGRVGPAQLRSLCVGMPVVFRTALGSSIDTFSTPTQRRLSTASANCVRSQFNYVPSRSISCFSSTILSISVNRATEKASSSTDFNNRFHRSALLYHSISQSNHSYRHSSHHDEAEEFPTTNGTYSTAAKFLVVAAITSIDKDDEEQEFAIDNTPHDPRNNHVLKPEEAPTREFGLYLASLKEEEDRKHALDGNHSTSYVVYRRLLTALEKYLFDPFATCWRFIQLAALFGPVLLSLPLVFFGSRSASRANETYGAVLWYEYLTWSMELAGPSFIKASFLPHTYSYCIGFYISNPMLVRSIASLQQSVFHFWLTFNIHIIEILSALIKADVLVTIVAHLFVLLTQLGQWAASRTDIFPEMLCSLLSKLHSNSHPHSLAATKATIEAAFGGRKFETIFEVFVEEPLGVGAIAQVYKARLAKDLLEIGSGSIADNGSGSSAITRKKISQRFAETFEGVNIYPPTDWVAIKVVHPGVDKLVSRDLSIMKFFAGVINFIPTMEWLSLPGEVQIFSEMMRLQLDLRIEAHNLEVFRRNFQTKPDIKFPKPFIQFSTRSVLVEEFIDGISMSKLLNVSEGKGELIEKEIANKGLDAFLKMLLLDNFIHADLHPGNIYVRFYRKTAGSSSSTALDVSEIEHVTHHMLSLGEDKALWQSELNRLHDEGYHAQLCFIDAGLVTELDAVNRRNFLDLFVAISQFDGYKVGELMVERSRTPETALNPEIFALKVQRLVLNIKARTFALGNVRVGDLLSQVLVMVRKHHVRMEGDFITVVLSILLLEGIGRQLDPNLDLFKSSLPILRQLGAQEKAALLSNEDTITMVKVWLAIEARQFITASIQDIHNLVKYDLICPNH